ncbi:uncharacterized protein LOC105796942 [Gossypium raimondii]|uniref:Uncharacterized protein n=1 Tax=Gossypium raimondii TaxID=29730 RepID=A0A0D2RGQ9_GOSRA|nr:uncharacterized protein LOC105796942 [Gossypium raimondii]KJB28806.1 hypothetical protein B456_005G070300 [Gossypium raimondii]
MLLSTSRRYSYLIFPLFAFHCRNLHCTNWQRSSSSSLEVIPDNQNHLRRITCSKTKLQVDRNHGSIRNCDSDSSERNIVILESDVFATKTTKDASTPCKNA